MIRLLILVGWFLFFYFIIQCGAMLSLVGGVAVMAIKETLIRIFIKPWVKRKGKIPLPLIILFFLLLSTNILVVVGWVGGISHFLQLNPIPVGEVQSGQKAESVAAIASESSLPSLPQTTEAQPVNNLEVDEGEKDSSRADATPEDTSALPTEMSTAQDFSLIQKDDSAAVAPAAEVLQREPNKALASRLEKIIKGIGRALFVFISSIIVGGMFGILVFALSFLTDIFHFRLKEIGILLWGVAGSAVMALIEFILCFLFEPSGQHLIVMTGLAWASVIFACAANILSDMTITR